MFNAELAVVPGTKRVFVNLEKATKFHVLREEVCGGSTFSV
jgi:hypothetical protein